MLRFLILLLLGYLFYQMIKKWFQQHLPPGPGANRKDRGQVDDVMVKDPYCEIYFPKRDGIHLRHGGEDLYFCSEACRDKFLEAPSDADA